MPDSLERNALLEIGVQAVHDVVGLTGAFEDVDPTIAQALE